MSVLSRTFWSNVMAVAYKEAAMILHDRPFLGVVLLQPVVQFCMFMAISNTPYNVPWAVLDRAGTTESRRLIEEVRTSGYFLSPTPVGGYEEGRNLLGRGAIVGLLVIPHDYGRQRERGEAEVQLLLDGSDPLTAARVGGYISSIAASSAVARPRTADGAIARSQPPGTIDVRQRFWFNATLNDASFFFSIFAAVLLTNLCLSATSLALTGERENGTYEQMLSLPTTPLELILGKLLPYVVICYFVLILALNLPGWVLGLWPRGSWLAIFVVTLPFVLAALAAGTLISTVSPSSTQSVFLSVFFILPSMVMTGLMMPYLLMPDGARHIGALLPTRWYQIALRGIVARGASVFDFVQPMLILTAMFAVMLAAIAWRTKPRLD